jgi:phage-related protein
MRSSQIGQALIRSLSGGAGGPIGIAIALSALNVAVQFVSALTGSLLGLLAGLSLVGLGIFGQRNDKEIKARAKKLGSTFTKELAAATKSFKLPIMTSLDVIFKGLGDALKILKPTLDAIAPVLPELAAGFSGFITEIAKAFADPATRDSFIKFLQVFAEELPKIGQAIGDLFRTIGQHANILAAVLRVFLGIVAGVFDVLNGLIAMSADNFETLASTFQVAKTTILVALSSLKTTWNIVWGTIKGIVKTTWTSILNNIKAVWTTIKGLATSTWRQIKEAITGPLGSIRGAAQSAMSGLLSIFTQLPARILSAVSGLNDLLWSTGWNLMLGLGRGIRDGISGVVDSVTSAINAIPDIAKRLLHINSPSLVMAKIGEGIPEGLVLGMQRGKNDVTGAASDVTGWATPVAPVVPHSSFLGMSDLSGASGAPSIRVFIGERELTDIVRVEVDGANDNTARALISGRRQ